MLSVNIQLVSRYKTVDKMATASFEKLFMNIPQLKSEKDWLVWKVMHAMKVAGL